MLVIDADITAGHKVLEYPADHFARSADALGDILLGEFFRYHQPAVLLAREFEQQARDAAVNIEQRERPDIVGQRAYALHEPVDELQREIGIAGHQRLEIRFGDDHEAAGFERCDRGRARAFVDDQLAEILARTEHVDDHFPSFGIAQKDFHASGQNDEDGVRLVAFVHDDDVLLICLLGRVGGQRAQIIVIERVGCRLGAKSVLGSRGHAAFASRSILP